MDRREDKENQRDDCEGPWARDPVTHYTAQEWNQDSEGDPRGRVVAGRWEGLAAVHQDYRRAARELWAWKGGGRSEGARGVQAEVFCVLDWCIVIYYFTDKKSIFFTETNKNKFYIA